MNDPKLKFLPPEKYTGVNHNDPIRFYSWPIIGKLYRQRVEMCLAELRGGERILEVGPGSGVTFLNLQPLYREIHGIDLTANVEAITQMWREQGLETHLRKGDVLQMPYEDNSFDAVLLISILEHLKPEEQPRAFAEIRRVLKPGGQVVYGVPIETRLLGLMFRLLGYDIRALHFSTDRQVLAAAGAMMKKIRVRRLQGTLGITGAVYEVGHFVKE